MLIFLSHWLARVRRDRHESAPLPSPPHLVHGNDRCDTSVAVPSAPTAFIAGQGARLYSLAAFRRPPSGPHLPAA
jgi:hypothetical protein